MIRHGESENNLKKRYTGHFDAKLTDKGRAEAVDIRPFLSQFRFDKVYSSDLCRAFETSQFALHHYTAEKTKLLREFGEGALENTPVAKATPEILGEDVYKQVRSNDYTHFGGENCTMVKERIAKFFKTLEDSDYDNVAAFTHGGAIMAALCNVIGDHNVRAIRRPNCMIAVFDYINGQWMLSGWIDPSIINIGGNRSKMTNDEL